MYCITQHLWSKYCATFFGSKMTPIPKEISVHFSTTYLPRWRYRIHLSIICKKCTMYFVVTSTTFLHTCISYFCQSIIFYWKSNDLRVVPEKKSVFVFSNADYLLKCQETWWLKIGIEFWGRSSNSTVSISGNLPFCLQWHHSKISY